MTTKRPATALFLIILCCSLEAEAQQPILSPRDSTEIIIAGKRIAVNYGRPSMRGRKIMGGLVPFNKVWRTGANEATSFVTEADLEVGGTRIPKGSYTLYTLPSETQWKLIINRQTGQWGLEYHQELDLARINLRKSTLREPVEKFTIQLERTGVTTGLLRMMWEHTMLTVRFTVLENAGSSSRVGTKR